VRNRDPMFKPERACLVLVFCGMILLMPQSQQS
jgi:hypothetical protein